MLKDGESRMSVTIDVCLFCMENGKWAVSLFGCEGIAEIGDAVKDCGARWIMNDKFDSGFAIAELTNEQAEKVRKHFKTST